MPVPEIDRLEKDSSEPSVQAAISSCIAMMVREGKEQKQAVAMCHQMVRDKMVPNHSKQGNLWPKGEK